MSAPSSKRSWRAPLGRLVLAGDAALLDAARALCLEAAAARHHTSERRALAGTAAWLKATGVPPRARPRLGLAALATGSLPYEREAANLAWLRSHGFRAPRPLAAGGLWRAGLPRHQFLVTEEVRAPTLEARLRSDEVEGPALEALGREVARLHAAGFVHRDLFPRNVLVDGDAFVLLDTRRGGRARPLRDEAYDLACLFLDEALLPHGAASAVRAGYASVRPLPPAIDARRRSLARRATRSARPSSSR